ncbi:MAG TPA: alpha/beta hydrolase [Thermoanaerobaculia bacterium]|jgi:pimeloyl-ACP methyl ester carboxylesterase|nr:alpha/beta hydrolase [Thermoanaerobaculia bacterium]
MSRGTGRSLPSHRGRRIARRLLLAGAAVGIPVAAAALLRRRAEPPSPPRWGRTHRYAGRWSEVVFQELGSGPPVLLLHSFGPGYGAGQWRAVAEILAERHCVYVPDLPGWGRTRGGATLQQPDRYLNLIEDFLAGVVREKAVVVAAGLAAAYAAQAAVDHPNRIRALALVSPLGLGEDGDDPARGAGRSFVAKLLGLPLVDAPVIDLLTGRGALEHHLRREVYAAPERVDAALLEQHYRASHSPQARAALAAYLRGDLWLDVSEELERLRTPVWIAWGRQSRNPPAENADLWLRHLPAAEIDIFEGAGALPQAETPALFCRALERFLAKLPE